MNGFRHLAHEAAGLPTSNLDLDHNSDPDTWPPILSFNNSEPPIQEFGIVSWPDSTFTSWGISTIPQSLLHSRAIEDLLTKPTPLLPLPPSTSGSSSRPQPPSSCKHPSISSTISTDLNPEPNPKPKAFLRLLHIPHSPHRSSSLLIPPPLLLLLFGHLNLDPHALYLHHTHTPGFHVLNCHNHSSTFSSSSQGKLGPSDEQTLRFYMRSNDVTTIWSYNVLRRMTLGICLVDERMKYKFAVVKHHIWEFRDVLGGTGGCVVVVADVARGVVWRGDVSGQGGREEKGREMKKKKKKRDGEEELQGAKASDEIYTDAMELSPVLMETLSRRCRELGRVVTKAQEAKSALRLAWRMARQLKGRRLWRRLTFGADAVDPVTEEANAQIRLVVCELIIPQLKARIFGWTCRQKEAVVWTNVLMARISRTDASTNHREASSMRVIAVMTMAFLPATFFATLFALPAFRWEAVDGYDSPGRGGGGGGRGEGDGVVQKSFWIWVAYSVPMTAVVFLVCSVTSSTWWLEWRKEWWRKLRPRRRRW